MAYHSFKNEETGETFGSFETFELDPSDVMDSKHDGGWYWQACFPGCLPDGEPNGPFATEQEAIDDAQSNA